MEPMTAPAPLTIPELRLAAAAVTALLPKYALGSPHRSKLKALQIRLFTIEQSITGDHPLYIEALQPTVEDLV